MEPIKDRRFIVENKTGYTSEIGRLVSMMDYARMTTLEAVNGLTAEELDYRIDGKGNSIGCLLHHIACVDEVYQIITFEERDPNDEELQKLEVGLNLGEKAHKEIRGNKLEFYQKQLNNTRENTLEKFRGKEDSWLDEITPFGPKHFANNYYRWFHVFEDELNHRGQIRLIRQHMKKKMES